MTLTKTQARAIRKAPDCVPLDDVYEDLTWSLVVFRVEHVVIIRSEGEDFYSLREAQACQRWLAKYAPKSPYAKGTLR